MPDSKTKSKPSNSTPTKSGEGLAEMPCYASSCGRVTLYLGDCRDVVISGDVLISDPPYGTGKYEYDDDESVVQILKGWQRKSVFGYPETLCDWAATLGKPDEWVTWWPTNKQIRKIGKLTSESEAIAIWGATHEVPMRPRAQDATCLEITRSRGLDSKMAKCGDVWRDASPGMCFNSHLRQHPNEKPESLMIKLVKLCSIEGETVCDAYMGSGTTGVAAIRTGRRFVGIEKDPKHYATAVERIKRELSQGDLFHSQHNAKGQ